MSIYKSSNFKPSLEEISVAENNTFSCQVNTSGENIEAYKMTILSGRGDQILYEPDTPSVQKVSNKKTLKIEGVSHGLTKTVPKGTKYYQDINLTQYQGQTDSSVVFTPIVDNLHVATITVDSNTYYIRRPNYQPLSLVDGKDYQWGVRTYNQQPYSTEQPNTLVCSGFLVGSTKHVTWFKVEPILEYDSEEVKTAKQNALDQVLTDRYIEYNVTDANQIIIGAHEPDDKVIPTPYGKPISASNPYIVRQKITYVTKDLGVNKDYIKIEAEDQFDYDFKDGTPFYIYQCDSAHTVKTFFADPNSNINISNYVTIWDNIPSITVALNHGWLPGNKYIPIGTSYYSDAECTEYIGTLTEARWGCLKKDQYVVFKYDDNTYYCKTSDVSDLDPSGLKHNIHKIVGYSSDTGELRFNETFDEVPKNGQYYVLFDYDSSRTYSPYGVINPIDGSQVTTVDASLFVDSILGGQPIEANNPSSGITYYTSVSNRWDNDSQTPCIRRLFIQPNINIKSDFTNPNEIIFDNGVRIDVIPQYWINSKTNTGYPTRVDITFNKLDNTQWILENYGDIPTGIDTLHTNESGFKLDAITTEYNSVPYISQTDYDVYTSFSDSLPYSLFYARLIPTINMQIRNLYDLNGDEAFTNLNSQKEYPYRCAKFRAIAIGNESVKYYNYKLYSSDELIVESPDYYNNNLTWSFKGLAENQYDLVFTLVDKYNKEFTLKSTFKVAYKTLSSYDPSLHVNLDCDKKAFRLEGIVPTRADGSCFAFSGNNTFTLPKGTPIYEDTDLTVFKQYADSDITVPVIYNSNNPEYGTLTMPDSSQYYVKIPKTPSVDDIDIDNKCLQIKKDTNLLYNYLWQEESNKELIIDPMSTLFTTLQITGDFVKSIPSGGEKELISMTFKNNDGTTGEISVRMHSGDAFYFKVTDQATGAGKYYRDDDAYKLFLYLNNNQINSFNLANLLDLEIDSNIKYMLQPKNTKAALGTEYTVAGRKSDVSGVYTSELDYAHEEFWNSDKVLQIPEDSTALWTESKTTLYNNKILNNTWLDIYVSTNHSEPYSTFEVHKKGVVNNDT